VYLVTANRPVADTDVAALAAGVVITTLAQRDRTTKALTAATRPCGAERAGGGGRRLRLTLREGRNRQVRRMLAALGYETVALHRESFMGVGLRGLRGEGAWRALDAEEMAAVRRAVRAAEGRAAASAAAAAGGALDWD
jgi:pseudouridine synthase